jgi:predicted anti-sigma-YlaC factor YlaD
MMEQCPDIEVLFAEAAEGSGPLLEHAAQCKHCSAILEEHRQIEKDLFRLVDPPPPPDFTSQVMARVAAQHAPMHVNVALGLAIAVTAFGLGLFMLVSSGVGLSTLGSLAGSALITTKSFWVATQKGVSLLWEAQALPMAVSLFIVLLICLFALRHLVRDGRALSEARISG